MNIRPALTSQDEYDTDLVRAEWWDRRLRILGAALMSCFGSMAVALFIWAGVRSSSSAEDVYELAAFFLYLDVMFGFLGAWFVIQIVRELRFS